MDRRKFVTLAGIAPLLTRLVEAHADPSTQPLLVLPENARIYETGHGQTRILVGSEESAGRWWLGNFLSKPGRKTSLHVHYSVEEQVYVLDGILSVWLDDRWHDLPAGGVAVAPRGIAHALGNRTAQPVRFLVAGEPAGFERFFADLEATARRLPYASPEFLAELAKAYTKYDSKLLGPPPPG